MSTREYNGEGGNNGANKGKSYNVGNTFSKKWDENSVNEKLDEMVSLLNDTPIYSISKLLSLVKLYTAFPNYIRTKFSTSDEIINKLDYIYTTVEANLFEKGIENHRVNGALIQFGLRAFHSRYDEQHINLKNEHSGDISINFIPPTNVDNDGV